MLIDKLKSLILSRLSGRKVNPSGWSTNWVRFVHIPDAANTGTLDKVLIRS
jgi:hypothetical protein